MEIVGVLEDSMRNKNIRVITIEGKGNHFCSGDDLKSMGPDGVRFKPLEDGSQLPHQRMNRLIRQIQKPVIALLKGYCLGAGFDLALACDFRIASDTLEIGDHRASRAICAMSGASWLLPRIVGYGRATELLLTGKHLTAKEAYEIGLITKYYPQKRFPENSDEFVKTIAHMPTKCLGYNKTMLNFSIRNEFFPSLKNEFKLYCKNIASKDFAEGMKSFNEKREPKFIGR
ncbi:MAG: 3-hydroxypropionyl-coenzyme A dehydratase [Promethearchaeota archaeon]|nr:MAG: 3-hydroxypropionyl-coenzyme A dehydratase [Candidatus Lokiarchaeota archaeon]